jgi:hypothetical protein
MQVRYANLVSAVPNATVTLGTPGPGLMDVRVDLACGIVAELYSVRSPADETHRRFAMFLCPDTATESEIYAESAGTPIMRGSSKPNVVVPSAKGSHCSHMGRADRERALLLSARIPRPL